MITADRDLLDSAILGGLLLSAGGSGTVRAARYRRMAEQALDFGSIGFLAADELPDDAPIFIATGVGAPGFSRAIASNRDAVQATQLLIKATGVTPAALMPGHVPGMTSWIQAAILGIPVVDAATNGRGHPTVKMGGMGLASRPEVMVTQAGCGGAADDRVEITVRGSMAKTSTIMRAASVQNGGLIYASRGPFTAGFVRSHGAPGALSFAAQLGRAMAGAAAGMPQVEAAAKAMGGEVLVRGTVAENTVRYDAGFDVGTLTVADGARQVVLHIYNEFMAAEAEGKRLYSFPDMMGSMDPTTGEVLAINELKPGRAVAIVAAPSTAYPIGAGARDHACFPEVEEKLGIPLLAHVRS